MLSVRVKGWPAGLEPASPGSRPGVLPLYHGHSGDGRARTGGLSPDKRALSPSELRPRESRGWDSNPRSRAHEAREDNRSSTALRSGWQDSNLRSPASRGRWGGQLPHSQKTNVNPSPGSTATLVGGRVYSLAGPNSTPYREVDQHVVEHQHPRRDSNPQSPG